MTLFPFGLLKTDGPDKYGLTVGPMFSSFNAMPAKISKTIIVSTPQLNFFEIFFFTLQEHFVHTFCEISTQNLPKTLISCDIAPFRLDEVLTAHNSVADPDPQIMRGWGWSSRP